MFIVLPLLITLHVLVCILMALVVLMQRPRSEGLGAAFGGGVTDNIFGAQTTHVLAKATTWLAGAFFALTLILSIITAKSASNKTAIQSELLNAPIPKASATPSSAAHAATLESPAAAASPVPAASPSASAVPSASPIPPDASPAAKTAAPAAPSVPKPAASHKK